VLYDSQPEPWPFAAFFQCDDGEWWETGQIEGNGPGGWDFGDVSFPYLLGRVEGGSFVEIRLGPWTIRRPVVDGWYLGVFWEAADDDGVPQFYRVVS
jgi:hypothetical protein